MYAKGLSVMETKRLIREVSKPGEIRTAASIFRHHRFDVPAGNGRRCGRFCRSRRPDVRNQLHISGRYAGEHKTWQRTVGHVIPQALSDGGPAMFGLNDGMRYYVCQRYVRMNLGINGLYKLVSQEMDLPPLSGAVFIFFSKNRQQVKLLRWDTDGFTLYQKRLERGTFEIPYFNTGKKACVMPYKTLSAIMSGISLRSVRYRKRLNIGSSVLVNT